jgi:hypothetical protein
MRRRVVWVLALVGCVAGAPAAPPPAWALDLLTPGLPLPSPTDVIGVIDALTKKDSDTKVGVKVGGTVAQGKLLVARTRADVTLERSSRNWRGRVFVSTTVPSDITYAIDLSELKAEHIRSDAERRVLVVSMPRLQVENVTPLLAETKTDRTYKRARFRFYDARTARDLENVILREDYLKRAREEGQARLPQVSEQGRSALQGFLQQVLRGAYPDVKVVVE